MKKRKAIISSLAVLAMLQTAFSCGYDDSAINIKISELERRIAEMENRVASANISTATISSLVNAAMSQNKYVTEVQHTPEGEMIYFNIGDPVLVRNGKQGATGQDGNPGVAPTVSVTQFPDGRYYWVINGVVLTDDSNRPVAAAGLAGADGADGKDGSDGIAGKDGKDAFVPELRISEGYWQVSLPGGTWQSLAIADGLSGKDGKPGKDGSDGNDGKNGENGKNGADGKDGKDGTDGQNSYEYTFMKSVTQDDDFVYVELLDGAKITLPKEKKFALVFDATTFNDVKSSTLDIPFTITGASGSPVLSVVCDKTLSASVALGLPSSSGIPATLNVTFISSINIGKILLTAVDGDYTAMRIITFNAPMDLCADGTANCYIVSEKGTYKFKTTKGNTNTSVGTVKGVKVLWESFGTSTAPSVGDIIKANPTYADGYIFFSTNDSYKEGNAVIAAYSDAACTDGNVLWSWHIWCTDKPQDQQYNNNAGTMMDRNLGATSATPGDVGALGLLYQWGRKDPFLSGSSISSSTTAASTITWPSAVAASSVLSGNNALNYSVSHPTTSIYNGSTPYDWYCTSSSYKNDQLWSATKSVYDPCPPGYRVPDGGSNGVWAKAFNFSNYWQTASNWDSTNKGMDFGKTDKKLGSGTIWYPASGYRSTSNGSLYNVGSRGNYWSCTPNSNYAGSSDFRRNGYVGPSYDRSRASGSSVRCLPE